MKANLESSQTANELAYEKLVTVVEASKETLALLIAVCDDSKLRDRIIQRYEQDLKPEFETYQLQLAKTEPSLRAALGAWAEQQSKPVTSAMFTVTGAESLLWFNLKDEDGSRTEIEKFFGYLQWGREGLREFPCPIVLWITSRILKNLSLKAPDFWSWRKGVFRFISDEVLEPFAPDNDYLTLLSSSESDSFFLPLEDLQELITKTEQREGAEAPLLGTLYSRLAQLYQRRIERGEAKNLQEERSLAIENYQKAILLQTELHQDSALINTLIDLGRFYCIQGRSRKSISLFQLSLQIAQTIKDLDGEASSLNSLGNAYRLLGEYSLAIDFYEQSLAIWQTISDLNGEAISLNNLGNVYHVLAKYQQAIGFYEQSLAIKRAIDDRNSEASSLNNLGSTYFVLGDYQRAIDLYGQSLAIQQAIGDYNGEASSLMGLANAYRVLGEYQRAIDFYEQSLAIQQAIGDCNGEASSLGNLGNVYYELGEYSLAIDFYEQSLAIQHAIGNRNDEARSWFNIGETLINMNRDPNALNAYCNARQLYAEIGLVDSVQECDNALLRLSSTPTSLTE
jgi:tetratricopeptide (TPR) repeat protein